MVGLVYAKEAIVPDLLIRDGEIQYSKPIARNVLRDTRISFGARGLFIFLWDLPSTWKPNVKHLSQMGPEGKEAIRSRLRELQDVGAIRFEAIQHEDGKLHGKRWILVNPQKWARLRHLKSSDGKQETSVGEIRESENPGIGELDTKGLQVNGSAIDEAEPYPQKQRHTQHAASAAIKRRRLRENRIITWTPDDERLADALEKQYSEQVIKAAAASIANPLPGLVQAELLRQTKAKEATAALEQIEQHSSKNLVNEMRSDPDAVETGKRLLLKARQAKVRRRTDAS